MWVRLMSPEQMLLTKWQSLSQDKQKQVLVFMDFLCWQDVPNENYPSKTFVEQRLQQIRTKIINYGKPYYTNSDVSE
ncbi:MULTISPECIES: hypothetical protein [Nostocaceae]|uniref:Uncharacterized protein n=2 Tax=Nostocaceae TaxID=1162 RepID=A0A1Z4KKU6_ANAVA|nr:MULTISPECIES: hypothetical protein [Nostocaceae]BAB75627.1 asl3928 [Nostoc sp. PCC 7120 = FACHB-418]BAY69554.1 hypothetical protein NIES23_23480 [Trichormus variabilis NIES-23]